MSATRSTVNLSESCSWLRKAEPAAGLPLAATIEVPLRIGPVELLRQVGEGGMGVVWAARHEVLARDVAVKFLLAPVGSEGESAAAEMFVQGARAAAAVRHPALTIVYDAGMAGTSGAEGKGVPYVVMELVDGPTLADVVRHAPLSPGVVRTVLSRLCDAVEELHKHELVHRDIKPSNIMINKWGEIMVTDFGLACPHGVSAGDDGPRRISGTPAYMAPEMYEGEVTPKSDVYAIGATVFELLTGGPPYRGTIGELRAAAEKGEVPRERLAERGVPEGVIRGIERCMNSNPLHRPKSASRSWQMFEQAFEEARPKIRAAGGDELIALALSAREKAAGSPEAEQQKGSPDATPVAATMFGLVSEMAERKRKSGPVAGEGSEPEAAAAPPLVMKEWPPGTVCAACGYSVAGVAGVRCPECGAMALSVSQPEATEIRRTRTMVMSSSQETVRHRVGPPIHFGALALCVVLGVVVAGIVLAVSFILLIPAVFIPVAVCLPLYRKIAFRGARGTPGTVCGWCGYSLRRASSEVCPECGHSTKEEVGPGETPPVRERGNKVRVFCITTGAFLGASVLGVGGMVGMDHLPVFSRSYHLAALPWVSVSPAPVAAAVFLGAVVCVTLVAFHLAASSTALLDGVARCGRCGAKGEKLCAGRCMVCEGRAGADGE